VWADITNRFIVGKPHHAQMVHLFCIAHDRKSDLRDGALISILIGCSLSLSFASTADARKELRASRPCAVGTFSGFLIFSEWGRTACSESREYGGPSKS